MELNDEVKAALDQLGLAPDQVASWREEGYTLIIITTAGEKHRLIREHLPPQPKEE